MKSDILIIVPARKGSRRFPNKNRVSLGGAPLAAWTQASILADGIDAPVLLTTDDEEVQRIGRSMGWIAPFLRPEYLARDETPTADAVLHALDWYTDNGEDEPGWILLLQITSPFRRLGQLRQAIDTAGMHGSAAAVVSMKSLPVPADKIFLGTEPLRPLAPGCNKSCVLVPSGSFYLVRTRVLRETGDFVPTNTLAQVHGGISLLDIDTILDLRLAEAVLAAGDWDGPVPESAI